MVNEYDNPLIGRYASAEMSRLWSPQRKHSTWRRLWVALAEAEAELGLPITAEQIDELRSAVDDIDFPLAAQFERELRHDVMAHVKTYGVRCPAAKGIIHLGATSCYVTDNTDLILMREGMTMIRDQLVQVIDSLARFASEHREVACLGFTHFQPAQPTTVGKRATLWCYDLVLDLEELEHRINSIRFRGVKGTTGTQATFLELFHGDHAKVRELERRVAEKMDFSQVYAVTGQTYSRKVDAQVLGTLGGIATSANKAGNDFRLLQGRKELEEPFETKQIGSSAMAYKRNPMRAERMCGLARFAASLTLSAEQTAATQWLERSLDDSANRRLTIPQSMLCLDAILSIYRNLAEGMSINPKVIERWLNEELPFMATEKILMEGVAQGGDRQELHERVRVHSLEAARQVKELGRPNDLIERLRSDEAFRGVDLEASLDPQSFIGRAPQQVDEFIEQFVDPIRHRYPQALSKTVTNLRV